MAWIKRLLFVGFIGLMSFLIALNVFAGLRIKGYSYLFRATTPFDLVIKHAVILDGTGENPSFRGDIGIIDGYIAALGFINPKDSPTFDAGGLTFIPAPVEIETGNAVVEHLLATSYPRYSADEIILREPPYEGMSLAQAARSKGVAPEEMFQYLKKGAAPAAKVLLAPLAIREDDLSAQEMLARLTSYRARLMERPDEGCIRQGFKADMHVFKTANYPYDTLTALFAKGELPRPVFRVKGGRFAASQ